MESGEIIVVLPGSTLSEEQEMRMANKKTSSRKKLDRSCELENFNTNFTNFTNCNYLMLSKAGFHEVMEMDNSDRNSLFVSYN